MFRKYADDINHVPNLEIVICDEGARDEYFGLEIMLIIGLFLCLHLPGHRLKNVSGTKTTAALRYCHILHSTYWGYCGVFPR
jgi:hypothetical protein